MLVAQLLQPGGAEEGLIRVHQQDAPREATVVEAMLEMRARHDGDHVEVLWSQPVAPQLLKRRADVVGVFPSEASISRLIGAVLLEANDEWQVQLRYVGVEALADLLNPNTTTDTLQLPPRAA